MRRRPMTFTFPEVFVISATRALLGFGLGLLLAGKLGPRRRRRVGLPAFLVGALSSVPILIHLFRKSSATAEVLRHAPAQAPDSTFAGQPSSRIV